LQVRNYHLKIENQGTNGQEFMTHTASPAFPCFCLQAGTDITYDLSIYAR
jgi:hypothetical protein